MNMLGPLLIAWRNAKGYDPARATKIRGLARAAGVVLAASLGVGLFASHSAKADIGKATLKFGREIAPLASDGASEVRLNGQSFFLREGTTDVSVKSILDEYEERCGQDKGALGEFWSQMPKSAMVVNGHKLPKPMAAGILRTQGHAGEGAVMCLIKGERTSKNVAEAFTNFAASQDLGDLGKLRYVYARQTTQGTRVVTAWTEDSFSFAKIANADGTAPGSDSLLPRPEGAKRLMTAEVVGSPYGVRIYQTTMAPEDVGVFYDKWAATSGDWRALAPEHPEGTMRTYFNGATQVVITARRVPGEAVTAMSIMEVLPGVKAQDIDLQ